MRESNSHQRFWRPLSYHLTNPLSKPTCKISFTVAIIHIKATIVKLIVHFYYKEFYKEDVYKRQILISAPIALIVVGPIGTIIGNGLAVAINFLSVKLGFIIVGILAATFPFIVMTRCV